MAEWVEAVALDVLQKKKKVLANVGGEDVVVYLFEGEPRAMADICVHKQKRLFKGLIFQGKLICPGHQWAFDVNTGWEEQMGRCQPVYDTRVTNGIVEIFAEPRVIEASPVAAAN